MKIDNLGRTQNRALMRLLLRVQAETHRLLLALGADIEYIVNQTVDADGLVDGVALTGKLPEVDRAFEVAMAEWEILFEFAREQAASIPFGGLAAAHNHFMRGLDQPTANRTIDSRDVDAVVSLWQGRRDRALRAAALRIEGDGLQLSQRIWRLKSNGLERIRSTLLTAMAERTSARELAKLLAPVLGAGQGCPRWSMHRLYGMTAGERATSKKGLFSGNECSGQGIAYNALRLARTELQYAHHANTMDIYQNAPWVEGYNVRLSPSHPKIDICDDLAAGGPYEATNLVIPAHPNCLCFPEAAVMPIDDFRKQVRGWLVGQNSFLDEYQLWSGFAPTLQLPLSMGLADALELWLGKDADGHAEALGL